LHFLSFCKFSKFYCVFNVTNVVKNIILYISAVICENHFTPDSFENKLTKPQSKNVKPRMIRRLKKGISTNTAPYFDERNAEENYEFLDTLNK